MTTYDATVTKRLALGDLESELANTRRVLERVPEDRFAWKPHDKSFSLGELATHLVNLLTWQQLTVQQDEFDLGATPPARSVPDTRAELLARYDEQVAVLRIAVDEMTVDDLLADWTLKHGGHEIFTQPRGAVLRSFGLTHMAHHRGQLTVYLRMLDVPLPQIFGPTADEPGG